MALNVLIVPDKFKGTLSAAQAAAAIAQGWRSARPDDRLELLPMSDGGDGFGEIIGGLLDAQPRFVTTLDAAHRAVEAAWWWSSPARTAIIESARVVGLAMLGPGRFDPFELDTFGLGILLCEASAHGARRALIGVGGSATNDAGFGMARALGWQFLASTKTTLTRWPEVSALSKVCPPDELPLFEQLTVAVDVQNQLLGPAGCTRVFGPQKGLTDFPRAERALRQLAAVMARDRGVDPAIQPGAGAGGGLGFGLLAFADARLESGIELFKRLAGLEDRLRRAQLVITGEGEIDAQTMMGKGVGEIATFCRQSSVPCVGLAGTIVDGVAAPEPFHSTYALTPDFADRESALQEPAVWLERMAAHVARQWRELSPRRP